MDADLAIPPRTDAAYGGADKRYAPLCSLQSLFSTPAIRSGHIVANALAARNSFAIRDAMKTSLISVAALSALMACSLSSAATISQEQMNSICEASAQTTTLVHKAHDQGVSKEAILKQINKGIADDVAASERQQLVDDIYAVPEPSSYWNWHDMAMRSCVATQKANLPIEESAPTILWRSDKSWSQAAAATHHQGTVVLLIVVKADSSVSDVRVVGSSGFENLDRAAVREAKHWEYRASVRGGKFYDGYLRIPLSIGGDWSASPSTP
jgi:TonB family protein